MTVTEKIKQIVTYECSARKPKNSSSVITMTSLLFFVLRTHLSSPGHDMI